MREYWETGENDALDAQRRTTLRQWCDVARGQFERHDEIIVAVADFVHTAMPQGDTEAFESPSRSLGWIIDSVCRSGHRPPPDTVDKPGWVCINAATLAAAMLRDLGYPVRECNVCLAQGGTLQAGFSGAIYQQAALQVWCGDQWNWVDPYLRIFDPALTRDDRSVYKVDVPCYWSRTSTPRSWHPAIHDSGWVPFEAGELCGTRLQQLVKAAGAGTTRREEVAPTTWPGPRVFRARSRVNRSQGSTTSGVFVRTPTVDVRLSLQDSRQRVTDRFRCEIPGSLHIARGRAAFDLDRRFPDQDQVPMRREASGYRHVETVFFGTRSLLAEWSEIGTHDLNLVVEGSAGTEVILHSGLNQGDHRVAVSLLPQRIMLHDAVTVIPFEVRIDPFDADLHSVFKLLLGAGQVKEETYWHATDARRALIDRAASLDGTDAAGPSTANVLGLSSDRLARLPAETDRYGSRPVGA